VSASRRTALRTVLWGSPVVLATIAAPAHAASPPDPLQITATQGGSGGSNKLLLTFSTGIGTLTINQVSRNGTSITVSPTGGISAAGGTSTSTGQSYAAGATYVVSYSYQSTAFTQNVVAS
jgi:hypothetical protein